MTHEKMTELEPLLEASGERNLRSIEITNGECPCHCLVHTEESTEESKKNTFEGNKSMFLGTLNEKAWREFLSEFNQKMESEITLDDFKEELWSTVVKYGEPVLMGTGLDEKARKELLNKMVKLREMRQKTGMINVKTLWSRIRFFPWFRATFTSWLYMMTKDHMKKHSKEYRQFLAEIGPEFFKRSLLTHRNAVGKESVGCLETIPKRESRYWRRTWRKT